MNLIYEFFVNNEHIHAYAILHNNAHTFLPFCGLFDISFVQVYDLVGPSGRTKSLIFFQPCVCVTRLSHFYIFDTQQQQDSYNSETNTCISESAKCRISSRPRCAEKNERVVGCQCFCLVLGVLRGE